MSLTLDGSNGIILPVGNLTSPSLGSAGAGMYVPAANTLAFVTNSLNRITIDSSGTVSLANNVVVSGTLTFGGTTISANTNLVTLTDSQTLTNKTLTSPTINGGSALDLSQLTVDGNTTLGDAAGDTLTINGTAVSAPNGLNVNSNQLVLSGGNLGLGTNTVSVPSGIAFEVYHTTAPRVKLTNSSTGTGTTDGCEISAIGSDFYINNRESGNIVFNISASTRATLTSKGLLVDYTSDSGLSGTGNAIFSGNVGIGTSSPAYKLTVEGTLAAKRSGANQYIGMATGSGEGYLDTINTLSTDYIGFYFRQTNNSGTVTRATLDSSGNLGLGVTPSAWTSGFKAIQISSLTSLYQDAVSNTILSNNTANLGNVNKYLTSAAASIYLQNAGQHAWYNAPSGTAGNPITFNQAMTLDASGNLLVGDTSTLGRLTIKGVDSSASNHAIYARNSSNSDLFRVRNDGYFLTGTASISPYNYTTGSAANVFIDSNGGLLRSTSSAKYKNSITDSSHGLVDVLKLRPVTYKGNNDGEIVFGGLIAEEVHDAGLTEFVQYNDDGEPDALAYGNMVSLAFKAIQELAAEIETLKQRN